MALEAGTFAPVTSAALIVAAGRGSRAGRNGLPPKQYALLAGVPVLVHGLRPFVAHPLIKEIAVVIHPEDGDLYKESVTPFGDRLCPPVMGGATRQESVRRGLEALAARSPTSVLIHDAARPFVDEATISRVLDGLDRYAGVIAAEPVTDTLKRKGSDDPLIRGTLERAGLWRAQTPQGFRFDAILEAHRKAAAAGELAFTDDAGLAEWAGLDVALVRGSGHNMKLTSAEDFAMAERLAAVPAFEPRTGTGFDVHRFVAGDHVWLCGVRIDHDATLEGHSDADAPLHALTDAILGALGDGDIGQHFPPSDPKWKGAASRLFVEDAARRVRARGGRITNVDITVLCERPKIGPHRPAMKQAIADMLGIDPSRVGIKATTTEQLGFTGRGEGLAAMASATLLLPA
jgi:2-C-methyl-D-erythritol 4-phosphate cytidylyltransferase/2-C-methyl-D-erythritol 2,4-cyclodiphosphate synthase